MSDEQQTNCRVDPQELVNRAVDCAGEVDRNEAGFWLATQARDNGYSKAEATSLVSLYIKRLPLTNTKGQPEPYPMFVTGP